VSFDLFISHCSADAKTAELLVRDFEKHGVSCWMAPRNIPIGSTYQGEIVTAIERCRAMLLLFSGATNKSEHVLREVELAAQSRKPIYPLRIDAAMPAGGLRYMLANTQWVEREALGGRLIETIEQLLGRTVEPPAPLPAPPRARVSSAVVAAGILGVCLLLAGGLFMLRDGWPWPAAKVAATTAPAVPSAEAPQPVSVAPTPKAVTTAPQPSKPAEAAPAPRAPQPTVAARSETPIAKPAAKPEILTTAPTRSQVAPGKVLLFKECDVCPAMAAIPAGTNLLGSPDTERGHDVSEGPQQQIVIANAFAAGRSEVSFAEWLACVAEGGCNAYRPGDYDWGYGQRPVINVSWTDARAYVAWLSRKTGATYRLLSEAEWEYAARGCVTVCGSSPFWFGAEISNARANYDWRYSYDGSPKAASPRKTVEIDASEPNPFGLLHVHGNVREWVEDCWNGSLAGLPADGGARMTGDCNSHVVRGGSWADEPKDLRSAARSWEVTAERRAQIGFRVARVLGP